MSKRAPFAPSPAERRRLNRARRDLERRRKHDLKRAKRAAVRQRKEWRRLQAQRKREELRQRQRDARRLREQRRLWQRQTRRRSGGDLRTAARLMDWLGDILKRQSPGDQAELLAYAGEHILETAGTAPDESPDPGWWGRAWLGLRRLMGLT